MILIYLALEQDRFSEYDAHYFPELDIPITRLSEPKNYRAGFGPPGITVLCAELPCQPDSREWSMGDAELGEMVRCALERAGLPLRVPIQQVVTRRLRQAYPIYRRGYEAAFNRLDQWLGQIEGLLTFGRQGLFAHDNTHHALYMAYCAADCLDPRGWFDQARWQAYRRVFETHVVED
jgi:protoporphyrinogen oxidase